MLLIATAAVLNLMEPMNEGLAGDLFVVHFFRELPFRPFARNTADDRAFPPRRGIAFP